MPLVWMIQMSAPAPNVVGVEPPPVELLFQDANTVALDALDSEYHVVANELKHMMLMNVVKR